MLAMGWGGGGAVIRWVVSSDSDDEPFKVFVRELTNPGPTWKNQTSLIWWTTYVKNWPNSSTPKIFCNPLISLGFLLKRSHPQFYWDSVFLVSCDVGWGRRDRLGGLPSITSKPLISRSPKLYRISYSSFPTSRHNIIWQDINDVIWRHYDVL